MPPPQSPKIQQILRRKDSAFLGHFDRNRQTNDAWGRSGLPIRVHDFRCQLHEVRRIFARCSNYSNTTNRLGLEGSNVLKCFFFSSTFDGPSLSLPSTVAVLRRPSRLPREPVQSARFRQRKRPKTLGVSLKFLSTTHLHNSQRVRVGIVDGNVLSETSIEWYPEADDPGQMVWIRRRAAFDLKPSSR